MRLTGTEERHPLSRSRHMLMDVCSEEGNTERSEEEQLGGGVRTGGARRETRDCLCGEECSPPSPCPDQPVCPPVDPHLSTSPPLSIQVLKIIKRGNEIFLSSQAEGQFLLPRLETLSDIVTWAGSELGLSSQSAGLGRVRDN